jgi:hypothetical protein
MITVAPYRCAMSASTSACLRTVISAVILTTGGRTRRMYSSNSQ